MAKGKEKSSSSGKGTSIFDRKDQAQPRLLRSRKREFPNEESLQTPTVPIDFNQQECAMMKDQLDQIAGQSSLTKQDHYKGEKEAEETHVSVKALQGQEQMNVTSPSSFSNLQGCAEHAIDDTIPYHSKSGMKEITPQGVITCQSNSDHTQAFLPTSEMADGSGATALKWQLPAGQNSQRSLERNPETSIEEPCNTCVDDVREFTKETAAGLPAKKKRRMGMCGMMEKERSNILETQKRENGQSGAERVEKQIYKDKTDDVGAQEEMISSLFNPTSVDSIREQSEAEIKLKSSHCGETDRAETKVHIVVTTCKGTGTVCDPGSSEEKGEAEGGSESEPKQTGEPKSNPPAQEERQEDLANQQQQEFKENTTEVTSKTSEKQKKDGDDRSPKADSTPAMSFHTNATQNEETGKKRGGIDSASLLVVDAKDGTEAAGFSPSVTEPEGFNCGPVELCGGAVPPAASERKDRCDPQGEPVRPTLNVEHPRPRDTTDPYESGCLDYVSDSQLNTIILIDEKIVKEKNPGCIDCSEDATDLISGLIRELSALNQKVMTTHRELENLRRGTKTSRSSLR